MDIKELVKFQLVSHGLHAPAQKGGVLTQFLLMVLVNAMDDIMKTVATIAREVRETFSKYFKRKVQTAVSDMRSSPPLSDDAVTLDKRHGLNTVVMTRMYKSASDNEQQSTSNNQLEHLNEEMNGMVDAVLAQISRLSNVPSFALIEKGQIMITYQEKPVQITRDIYCKIDAINFTQSGNISAVRLTLLSNTVSAADIAAYVKSVYTNYLQELKNSIGDNIYFFDQKSKDAQPPPLPFGGSRNDIIMHKRMMISSAPKQLSFSKMPFYSNKQFSNIFGKEVREIEKRVRFFLDNKDWYDSKGVPYQLGLLLSGIPGAGKTSVIRAIANLTRRHIVNVNFSNITTSTQLKNLFFSDKLQVYSDQTLSNVHSYFIPLDQRLYVLEEIDAIGDIVKQRGTAPKDPSESISDELTLAEILTVLDGTMESPGRIIVMTSNHPELLDQALIRPGRIDVQVTFGNASRELIAEMFEAYFGRRLTEGSIGRLPSDALSPAEVGQVLFRHFNTDHDDDTILEDITRTAQRPKPAPPERPSTTPLPTPAAAAPKPAQEPTAATCKWGEGFSSWSQ